ncbi:centrosomal protein kizuna isoform X2 [Cottoperca gobio]|uniref:Centrosomal protein kizuna n=1 Tax=Cottoperca gobio TaxID=56716 RepID=A0A6J2S3A9_COTGO|nr:centrosomal protein kizuna isoform X2 [Cottoperca gobio]
MVTNVNNGHPPPPLPGSAAAPIREKMENMSRSEEQYYEKITSIQLSMHKREKQRLELERELFVYSRSDKRISQIKYSKLHSYLKEICDREARAKMRNLELLRDVECIEISMKEYSPDHGSLQQQKADFLKKISTFMEAKKNIEKEPGTAKVEAVQRRHQDSSPSQPVRDFTQAPAVIFMGRQTSRGSDAEAGTTSVLSHQALHRSPNRSMHSRERLPSGLLKDFRVGGEDAASNRAHLSDDISGSNDSPDGCNLSDKHERTMAMLPSIRALTGSSGNVPFGSDDEPEPSPLVTLTGPEKNVLPGSSRLMKAKNSKAEHTDSREVAHQTPIKEDGERALGHFMPQATFGEEAQDIPGRCESVSSDVQLSESSASDLSISLTQSELEEDPPEGLSPEQNATSEGSDYPDQHSPESSLYSHGCENTPQLNCKSSAPAVTLESTSLPPDAARLWDRWFKHALLLKEHRVLSTERLVQLFTPLLLERHATYSHQAKVLLRTLVSRSSEECPSAEDESDLSSSCGRPSPLADGEEKPARPVQKQPIQELQSTEEESQDESPVESVPIRETKAYQLLKQSAMQERLQSSEEEEEEDDGLSGINHGHEEDLGRAKRSSHQDPYPRKEKSNSKAHSTLQSKAFWGESDDSNSEIEAALRPQPFNTNNGDIDDFSD